MRKKLSGAILRMWHVIISSAEQTPLEFRFADVTSDQDEGLPFPKEFLKKTLALSKVEDHYDLCFGLSEVMRGGKFELDRRARRRAKSETHLKASDFVLLYAVPMENVTNLSGIALLLRTFQGVDEFEIVGLWIADFQKAYGPESRDLVFSILQLAISEPSLFLHVYLFFPVLNTSSTC